MTTSFLLSLCWRISLCLKSHHVNVIFLLFLNNGSSPEFNSKTRFNLRDDTIRDGISSSLILYNSFSEPFLPRGKGEKGKSTSTWNQAMDIEDWELLPTDGGLIELSEGNPDKMIFHEKLIGEYYDPKGVFNRDYFNSRKRVDPPGSSYSRVPSQLVPVSTLLDRPISNTRNKESIPEPTDKGDSVQITEKTMDPEQDMVSQVFFKKMETEFVDMKMDSPRSGNSPTPRGITLQVDVGSFQFDEEGGDLVSACSQRKKPRKQHNEVNPGDGVGKEGVAWEGSKGGFNIWKWSLTGVGALCSFGFAAATICIFIVGSSNQNQKLQLQICADDKVE
ncbi:hypothetical protein MLD38_004564 [Melastoma candidum]|uniref:Uncharacterized protein n=1 Tax=Melastoma candidum TaxID=119954 RepID=A0ACB9S7L6_9MYRT|nr:hypothetical protein MLD38_004564 [Melastoma candidum]